MLSRKEWEFKFLARGVYMEKNLITTCCICGNEVETKKILPYRNLIGSDTEFYKMNIAQCKSCGFIFQQNPLTSEQLENCYRNESKYEFDSENNVFNEYYNYSSYCNRQKHFIDENISNPTRGL